MSTTENPSPSFPQRPTVEGDITPDRWRQIKEVFADAQERSAAERDGFLREACGADELLRKEVESLLAAAAEDEAAAASLPGNPSEHVLVEDAMVGRRIGAYKIIQRIGRGGMATVYLASRADEQYEKQVAIKILLPELGSEELLRRFRNERQTLAKLDHPNIVKLLDGGSTEEGLPYLVMDYVEGEPIDKHCDSRNLSTDERLRLFCQVCAAVQCAHQNLIVHRDLKPSNILITESGIPKLLDFGISKVLHLRDGSAITQTLTRRMTPAYASPEQVKGEAVSPATDIYSLGVVLYELLTGHRPYRLKQQTPAEVERAICEQEPEKPSTAVGRVEAESLGDGTTASRTPEVVSALREGPPEKLRRRLSGDLDNIVLMALQKEPRRRYLSVDEFLQDVQRHLEHRPVKARPNTLTYRTVKFIRRRQTEVIAVMMMAVALTAAFGYVMWERRRATERARAELADQRSRGRRSIAVLGFKNLSGRPDTTWLSTALSEMLTTELSTGGKLRTIPGESVAKTRVNLALPEADSFSTETLERVYKNLGSDFVVVGSYLDMNDASRSVRLDLRLQDAALGETVASLAETGSEADLPELVTRAGVGLREKLGVSGISPEETVSVQASLPANLESARLYAEGLAKLRVFDALSARELLEKAIAVDPKYSMAHSALSDAWNALGYEQKAKEQAKAALDLASALPREQGLSVQAHYFAMTKQWDKAADTYRALFSFFPDNLDYGLNLAEAQVEAGQRSAGTDTLTALRKLPPPLCDDPRIDLTELGAAMAASDYKHELAMAEQAGHKGEMTGNRLLVAEALFEQGHAYRNLNEPDKARGFFAEARRRFAEVGDRYSEGRVSKQLGIMLAEQNDLEGAKKAFQETLQIAHELGNKSGEAAELDNIGNVLQLQRNLAGAADSYERSVALAREVGDQAQVASSLHNLGLVEYNESHLTRARERFQEALPLAQRYADKDLIAGCMINLAHVHAAQGNLATALKLADESRATLRQTGAKGRIAALNLEIADLKLLAGNLGAAQKFYEEAMQSFMDAGQEFDSSFSLFGLGDILLARDNLSGARQQHEAALALRRKEHGAVRELFDSRIRTAQLSLEEGHPDQAETDVRQALKEYPAKNEPDAQIEADTILIRSLLAQGRLEAAKLLVTDVRRLVGNTENRLHVLAVNLLTAQVDFGLGRTAETDDLLRKSIEESKASGFADLEFEFRLLLGEIEMKTGNRDAARGTLTSLEKEATARGFLLIAHKAAAARKHRNSSETAFKM